jgi:hypothetical protein
MFRNRRFKTYHIITVYTTVFLKMNLTDSAFSHTLHIRNPCNSDNKQRLFPLWWKYPVFSCRHEMLDNVRLFQSSIRLPLPLSFCQYSIIEFILILLLPEARDCDVWEPVNRTMLFQMSGSITQKYFFLIAQSSQGLTDTNSITLKLCRLLKHAKRALSLYIYNFICFRSTIYKSMNSHPSIEIKIRKNKSTGADKNKFIAIA